MSFKFPRGSHLCMHICATLWQKYPAVILGTYISAIGGDVNSAAAIHLREIFYYSLFWNSIRQISCYSFKDIKHCQYQNS